MNNMQAYGTQSPQAVQRQNCMHGCCDREPLTRTNPAPDQQNLALDSCVCVCACCHFPEPNHNSKTHCLLMRQHVCVPDKGSVTQEHARAQLPPRRCKTTAFHSSAICVMCASIDNAARNAQCKRTATVCTRHYVLCAALCQAGVCNSL